MLDGGNGSGGALLVVHGAHVHPHVAGDIFQASGANQGVERLNVGQQHGVADTVGQVVETAQLVGHGVHIAQACVVEGHAGQELGIGHLLAGMEILPLMHGGAKVFGNQCDGHHGAGIGDRGGGGGDIGLNGVGQGIHAGSGGETGRLGQHQLGIVDRHQRGNVLVDDGHFHVARFVGDDAEAGHLGGGTGGGVDGDKRQLRLGGAIHPFVILDAATVGGDQRDALGAVVGRAATQRDDAITAVGLDHRQTRFDVAGSGVGFGLIENSAFNAMFSQQGGELGDHADLVEDLVGDDQRLAIAVTLDIGGGLLQTAGTHQVNSGNIELECSHDGLPIVSH